MTVFLKQSTAIDIRVGPFMDVGDAFTPETGVTIGAADEAEILKADGAATVTMAGAFAAVSGCAGWYDYTLSAGDTDTVGELVIVMQDLSVYLPVFVRAYVVEEAVYDAMYAATAEGPLQATTAGRTLDIATTGEAAVDFDSTIGTLDAAQFGADFLTAAKIADNAFIAANFAAASLDGKGDWNIGKTGYSLTQAFPTNFADMAIAATTGEVDADVVEWLGTAVTAAIAGRPDVNMKAINSSSGAASVLAEWLKIGTSSVADSGSTTTIVDAALTEADDAWNGYLLIFTGGGNVGYAAIVTDFDAVSDTITFAPAVPTGVTTENFTLVPGLGYSDVRAWLGALVTAATAGTPDVNMKAMFNNTASPQILNDWMRQGTIKTATGGSTTTLVDTTLFGGNDYWNGSMIMFTAGSNAGYTVIVTDYDSASDTMTFVPALPTAVTTEDYTVVRGLGLANVEAWLGTAVGAATAGRPDVNVNAIADLTLAPTVLGRWLSQGANNTADSGSTTTIVDTQLAEADDFWNGSLLVFTSGANAGYAAIVTDFDAASDTLTFTPAVPTGVTTEVYVLIPGLGYVIVQEIAAAAANTVRDAILPTINIALDDIPFLMVLTSDHFSAATGLTVTATRSIDGGTTFASTTGTVAEAANGIYHFDASAADMNGEIITFKFSAATADNTFVTIRTGG